MPGPAVYPAIVDWNAYVEGLTPAPSYIGDSAAVVQALAWPWSVLEQGLYDLAAGLVDLDAAAPWVVEVRGKRVDEPVGGLGVTEYKRIVAGRELAVGSTGSIPDAYAVLQLLAGAGADSAGRIFLLRGEGPEVNTIVLNAYTPGIPSPTFILRAGAIVRDALPLSAEAEAALATASTAIFDAGVFDGSTFGYTLPVE